MKLIGCEKIYTKLKVRIIGLKEPILVPDKLDFKAKSITRDNKNNNKGRHKIINMYKSKAAELKAEPDKSKIYPAKLSFRMEGQMKCFPDR